MDLSPNEFKELYDSPIIRSIKIFRKGIIFFARIIDISGTTKIYWHDQNFNKWKLKEE